MKKLLIGGLVGLSLVFPNFAGAVTIAELQAQINSLLAMVAQLQAQLAGQTGSSGGDFCYTFNADLKVGDRGVAVAKLQTALENEGFSIPDSEKPQKDGETMSDTVFGEVTASRVSAFQEKYRGEILTPAGLSYPSGYVGARTRAKLNQLYRCSQPIAMCDYAPAPANCQYVNGPNFNPTTQCGKILSCSTNPQQPIACTMDAKLCPDGSYVGRTGPSCEFATCPTTTNTSEKPDLIVGAVACEPLNININENKIFCQVTVWNNSSVDVTKSFDVNIQGSAVTINGLKAQERKTVKNPLGFGFSVAGNHTLHFPIDIWNSVDESNENNNSHSMTISIGNVAPAISTVKISSPYLGAQFVQGQDNSISWYGGKGYVKLALVTPNFNINSDLLKDRFPVGWISLEATETGTINWTATTVTDLSGNPFFQPVLPGEYRILAVSQGVNGNFCLSSSSGECNNALSGIFTIKAVATTIPTNKINVAASANGANAISSSDYSDGKYPAYTAIDGDKSGANWGNSGGWNDGTQYSFPDWLEVQFAGNKTIDEIDVYTLRDNYAGNWQVPNSDETFSAYGITAFDVQYWNGSSWVTVPGGSVQSNYKVLRKFTFDPITTNKIRVVVNNGIFIGFSRIVEVEAY